MIYLRPYQIQDAEKLTEIKRKKEVQVFGSNANLTANEFHNNVIKAIHNKKLKQDYTDFYTICLKDKNKEIIIGSYVLRIHIKNNDAEIGIFIDPDYWGNGYATKAHKLAFNIAKKLNLNKLIAEVDYDNIASKKSLVKAGYNLIKIYNKYKQQLYRFEYELIKK